MGYTTDFEGEFTFNKPLDAETHSLLTGLATTRRMVRKLGPEYGVEGEFYVESTEDFGQARDASIIDYNRPPKTQPGLWLGWIPNEAGTELAWDGGEKFYRYVDWLNYLIVNILEPRGYSISGEVEWQGEDSSDFGKIIAKDNSVSILNGKKVFE